MATTWETDMAYITHDITPGLIIDYCVGKDSDTTFPFVVEADDEHGRNYCFVFTAYDAMRLRDWLTRRLDEHDKSKT